MANVRLDLTKEPPEVKPVGTEGTADHSAADPSHTETVMQPAQGSTALYEQIMIMKKEIDLLQLEVAGPEKPWWRQVSVVVSVAALLAGLATTSYAQAQANASEVREARAELRELLVAVEDANLELRGLELKYGSDPGSLQVARDGINTRRTILVEQAADVLEVIGDEVTGVEYFGVGAAIQGGNPSDPRVTRLYEKALAGEMDGFTRIGVLHSLAYNYFSNKDVDKGRRAFEGAIEAADGRTDAEYQFGNTHLYWASNELAAGNCGEAQKHFRLASEALDRAAAGLTLPSDVIATRNRIQAALVQPC